MAVFRTALSRVAILILMAMLVVPGPAVAAAGTEDASAASVNAGYSDEWFGRQLAQLWSYDAGTSVFSPPVIDGGLLYSGSDGGRFFALDAATGQELWRFDARAAIKDRAFVAGERVYFSTLLGDVVALSLKDGSPIWSVRMPERIDAGVIVAGGHVIVPCSDGVVRGLSTADGSIVWQQPLGLGVRLLSTPAAAGQSVLVEIDAGIAALDPVSGSKLWQTALSGEFRYWPVVNGDYIVTAGSGDAQGGLRVLASTSGEILAKYVYGGDNHWAAPAVDPADGSIYAGLEGGVFSFDATLSRRAAWVGQPPAISGRKRYVMWQPLILRQMVVVPGHLEIATQDALFYFSRDGSLSFLGKTLLPEKLAAPPIVHNSVLYYGSTSGHLLALAPVRVTVNGHPVDFGLAQPLTQPSGRVVVPARAVIEAAGGVVGWDQPSQTVTARYGERTVQMVIDSSAILVDGQPVTIDEPARAIEGTTMLPIRAVIEGLGGQVSWDAQARTVVITLGGQ